MGYHLEKIPKGILGEFSKIEEELSEYRDAKEQDSKIMMAVELADLYGAIRAYKSTHNEYILEITSFMLDEAKKLGLTSYDLVVFANITARAFKDGTRG